MLKEGDIIECKYRDNDYYIAKIHYTYQHWKDVWWAKVSILKSSEPWAYPKVDTIMIGCNGKLSSHIKKVNPLRQIYWRNKYGKYWR